VQVLAQSTWEYENHGRDVIDSRGTHRLWRHPHHITWCVLSSVSTLLHTPFAYHVGYDLWTQEVPPWTREVTPTTSRDVYFGLYDTLLHSPFLVDPRGTPMDSRGNAYHITWCVLRSVWYFAPHTCISNSSIQCIHVQDSVIHYSVFRSIVLRSLEDLYQKCIKSHEYGNTLFKNSRVHEYQFVW